AREADEPLVAPALHRGARVDPALRPGTPGSGRDALLSRVRARADPRPPAGGRGRRRRRRGGRSRRPDPLRADRGLDLLARALAGRCRPLLRRLAELPRPPPPPRAGAVRLPRLGDTPCGP